MNAPIAVTMGEPAGIGGEIALGAYLDRRTRGIPFFLIDDPCRVAALADRVGWNVPVETIGRAAEARTVFARALPVLPIGERVPLALGEPTPKTAGAVLGSIDTAVALCLSGEASGMVTNPIQKETLYDAGFGFPGHTEYLAALVGGGMRPVMMLAGPSLKVVPVTVQVPLRTALEQLTTDAIVEQGKLVVDALRRDFGIVTPRLAVAGLNPHAGENGKLGMDEIDIISPAIEALRDTGAELIGPVPPDALFTPRARQRYDAALCMYHDQALIPIKALDFDHAVNVTLGLPIVRTSPDHGTALDIAGQGLADPSSLVSALKMASSISASRAAHER